MDTFVIAFVVGAFCLYALSEPRKRSTTRRPGRVPSLTPSAADRRWFLRREQGIVMVQITAMAALANGFMSPEELTMVERIGHRHLEADALGGDVVEWLTLEDLDLTARGVFEAAVARKATPLDPAQRRRTLTYVADLAVRGAGFPTVDGYRGRRGTDPLALVHAAAAGLGIDAAERDAILRAAGRRAGVRTRGAG